MATNAKINPRRELKKPSKALPTPAKADKPKPEKAAKPEDAFKKPLPPHEDHTVKLTEVVFDNGTQMRPKIDEEAVDRYVHAIGERVVLPPIVLFNVPDRGLVIADGIHRFHAHEKLKIKSIAARIYPGTLEDAVRFAIGANAGNGLPRDRATVRNAVHTMLAHPTWGKMSTQAIADAVHVAHGTVSTLRKDWDEKHNVTRERVTDASGKSRPATGKKKDIADKMEEKITGKVPESPEAETAPAVAIPTDEEWLETLPVRPGLSDVCRRNFDRDSIKARKVFLSPEYLAFVPSLRAILKRGSSDAPTHGGLYVRFLAFLNIPHPKDAKVCVTCGGTGEIKDSGPCGACNANGYQYS